MSRSNYLMIPIRSRGPRLAKPHVKSCRFAGALADGGAAGIITFGWGRKRGRSEFFGLGGRPCGRVGDTSCVRVSVPVRTLVSANRDSSSRICGMLVPFR
jgi:hypothetical protein